MKLGRTSSMQTGSGGRTESPFVRYLHQILMYGAEFLRPAQPPRNASPGKENCMPDQPEIPTDAEVLAALQANPEGLTPTALIQALQAQDHSAENIIRAIQRVLDRGTVHLSDDAKLVVAEVEPAYA